jgi:ABC-type amino acid transport substrate-binding protein
MLTKSLRSNLIFYILIILFLVLISSCTPLTPQVYTEEEQQWLASHKGKIDILLGYEAPPNAFHDSDGSYKGLLVDFLAEIEKKIGMSFVFHHFNQWN